ncbi:hypothetical protein GCM10008995_19640 [Halobellus salinus]|uniref:Uncharacterized protein n=1 Tax=Halobellus salinus TaxID=931585 RepID=A0A830EPT9_9EURY|nr:DUF5794 domain-containing protein [Halobellus salinus]GGJ09808.1 hypothetical protein GCM10008995_19640 [Halobellus salinus]SMP24889.1 hypothetical protein SAMN06265347_11075 [Halobellus salinus]
MSVSRHPVALRLEERVGRGTRLLATVMSLPLVDGIFPALIIAGALGSPLGILETGLLIFGGSATVAVILAEMQGTRREQITSILLLGALLLPVAGVEALFAETLRTVLNFEVFQRFAGLVILAVAAKTASAKVGEYLPSPSIIIGLGLVASLELGGAALVVEPDLATIGRAVAAAGVGVGFALAVAVFGPTLRGAVDLDRFRFGSSVALGMLAIDVLGLLPTQAPVALGVLGVTALFAYDPSAETADGAEVGDDPVADDGDPAAEPEAAPPAAGALASLSEAVSDGGDAEEAASDANAADDDAESGGDVGYGYPETDGSRSPWL